MQNVIPLAGHNVETPMHDRNSIPIKNIYTVSKILFTVSDRLSIVFVRGSILNVVACKELKRNTLSL